MKGLELAQEYYEQVGRPMLEGRFGELIYRVAVGFAGAGSECFGFDDEISRDHDWGPAFCIWLNSEDYREYGKSIQNAYESLPKSFKGYGPRIASPGEEFRVGTCPTELFYATYTGLNHVPGEIMEWMRIPDSSLAMCTNGRVFTDPLGEFSSWREALLAFYPEDVRLKKIASRCATIAQSGQYNLPRSLKRGETFSAFAALTQFCTDAMSLIYLLNKRYAPFYKWLHRGVKELPLLGQWAHNLVTDLIQPTDLKEKPPMIENACAVLIKELKNEGLSDSPSDFLLEHAHSVHSRISDEALGKRFNIIN